MARSSSKAPVVNWHDLVPADWRGECVLCGAMLGPDDFRHERVIASVPGPGCILGLCLHHVATPSGEKAPEFERAIHALAKATVQALGYDLPQP